MFGVSPAFIVSNYGTNFTCNDFLESMGKIKRLGYDSFQPEVYLEENLNEWLNTGAKDIYKRANELGLCSEQFVAHFMMEYFSNYNNLISNKGIEELKKIIDIALIFNSIKTITIPIGTFKLSSEILSNITKEFFIDLKKRFIDKLELLLEQIENTELRLALEIMPFSIIDGIDGFLDINKKSNTNKLGINFDTGHAMACKEDVNLVPLKLEEKIFGTHLCDNFTVENLSVRPGRGLIDWEILIKNLKATNYQGSYDIEIICKKDLIEREYGIALKYISLLVNQEE